MKKIIFTYVLLLSFTIAYSQNRRPMNALRQPAALNTPMCGTETMLSHGSKPEDKKMDNPALVYQICIDRQKSDNVDAQLAKHLVGTITLTNKGNCVFNTVVHYWWKGNHIAIPLNNIVKNKDLNFDLTELKSNIDTKGVVVGANTVMICDR